MMINFRYIILLFSIINILASEYSHDVKFYYNDQVLYKYKSDDSDTIIELKLKYKGNKIKIADLKKDFVEAKNKFSERRNNGAKINCDDIILLYVGEGRKITSVSENDEYVTLGSTVNFTKECHFYSKSMMQSIREIKIRTIIINGEDINIKEAVSLNGLPNEAFAVCKFRIISNIADYVRDNSEEVKAFLQTKRYNRRNNVNLYNGKEKLNESDLMNKASELKKSNDIKLICECEWLKNIKIEYKPERDSLSMREHVLENGHIKFKEKEYGESWVSLPTEINLYYDEKTTAADIEKKVKNFFRNSDFINEYEYDNNIYDYYDSKEVKKQKVINNKNRVQLPEGVTWDTFLGKATHVIYVLSERSEAVKTKIIQLDLCKKNRQEVTGEIKDKPIVIVLDGNEYNKEGLERKLKEKTFYNGMKLSDNTINSLLTDGILDKLRDTTQNGIFRNNLEITDEEEKNLLNFYINNKLEENVVDENKKEDEENGKEDDKNGLKIGGPNIPKCCNCCSDCSCKGK